MCVIFGDGAGAVVLQPTDQSSGSGKNREYYPHIYIVMVKEGAEILAMYNPGTHANHWKEEKYADFDEASARCFQSCHDR